MYRIGFVAVFIERKNDQGTYPYTRYHMWQLDSSFIHWLHLPPWLHHHHDGVDPRASGEMCTWMMSKTWKPPDPCTWWKSRWKICTPQQKFGTRSPERGAVRLWRVMLQGARNLRCSMTDRHSNYIVSPCSLSKWKCFLSPFSNHTLNKI